jgi:hypothetical protein
MSNLEALLKYGDKHLYSLHMILNLKRKHCQNIKYCQQYLQQKEHYYQTVKTNNSF